MQIITFFFWQNIPNWFEHCLETDSLLCWFFNKFSATVSLRFEVENTMKEKINIFYSIVSPIYLSIIGKNEVVESKVRMVLLPLTIIFSRVTRRMVSSPVILLLLTPLRNFVPNIFISIKTTKSLFDFDYCLRFSVFISRFHCFILIEYRCHHNFCENLQVMHVVQHTKYRWTVKIGIDSYYIGRVGRYLLLNHMCAISEGLSTVHTVFVWVYCHWCCAVLYHQKIWMQKHAHLYHNTNTVNYTNMNGSILRHTTKTPPVHKSNNLNFLNFWAYFFALQFLQRFLKLNSSSIRLHSFTAKSRLNANTTGTCSISQRK